MQNPSLKKLSHWLPIKAKPFLIAGPCSVESESQMLETARGITQTGLASALRGGIWKPRTSPGSFEGVGKKGLQWLKRASDETGLPAITEVANAAHVEAALDAEIQMLWIGARTTVNPFYVQEIAEALRGVDVPIFVKNPIHPEVKLWMGALERFEKVGVTKLATIHRGFFAYRSEPFRNEPKWEVFFEMRRLAPELPIICDPSHIAGKRELLKEVCQSALDLGMDGFMIETHRDPHSALSDAAQQVTPSGLQDLISGLETRHEFLGDKREIQKLEELRREIDQLDGELLETLKKRFQIVEEIGEVKEENKATVFQMKRWFKVLQDRENLGQELGMKEDTIHELFQLIHKYSIELQMGKQVSEKL